MLVYVKGAVFRGAGEVPAVDEHQARASPRSAPASRLHPRTSSGDAITAPFHADAEGGAAS
jgi:hypothetical protein